MKEGFAKVKNLRRLSQAYESLSLRSVGIPGMGLVFGRTGSGKTTGVNWLVEQTQGVYVRSTATWTASAMLGAIVSELGSSPGGRNAAMLTQVCERLRESNRPLFVDEADYLLQNVRMIETLRDIHDISGVPVIMIGLKGIEKRLVHREQLSRRISQFVEFQPVDMEDARTLAEALCEVAVGEDLLRRIHKEARGGIGLMAVGLERVEALARTQQWEAIDASGWGNRKLFLSKVA